MASAGGSGDDETSDTTANDTTASDTTASDDSTATSAPISTPSPTGDDPPTSATDRAAPAPDPIVAVVDGRPEV